MLMKTEGVRNFKVILISKKRNSKLKLKILSLDHMLSNNKIGIQVTLFLDKGLKITKQ